MVEARMGLAKLNRAVGIATVIFILGLSGCAIFHRQPPPPAAPPALSVDVSPFVGSPLSGPTTARAPTVSQDQAIQIDVDWSALQKFPADELLPLDAQSSLTSAPLASGPVLTVGRTTRLIRFGDSDSAQAFVAKMQSGALGQAAKITHQSGMFSAGTTVRFAGVLPHTKENASRSIVLSVGRLAINATTNPTTNPTTQPGDGMMSIGVEGLAGPATGAEIAYLDRLSLADDGHFVILLPCAINGTPWNALVAEITTHHISNDATGLAAVGAFNKDLANATARAKAGVSIPPPGNQAELESAINSLNQHDKLRPPLLFLATNTGAQIATDVILVADDPMLGQLRDQVLAQLAAQKNPAALGDLSWILDRASLMLMTAQATKNTLPPEMASVLVLHAGEVGRHPDSLEDIVKGVSNSADLKLRLIGENFIALEDSSPGARVRAYDWLKAQNKAPAGFDPMADRKSRRDAINKALGTNGGAQ